MLGRGHANLGCMEAGGAWRLGVQGMGVHGGWGYTEAEGTGRLQYHGQSHPKKNPLIQNGSSVL